MEMMMTANEQSSTVPTKPAITLDEKEEEDGDRKNNKHNDNHPQSRIRIRFPFQKNLRSPFLARKKRLPFLTVQSPITVQPQKNPSQNEKYSSTFLHDDSKQEEEEEKGVEAERQAIHNSVIDTNIDTNNPNNSSNHTTKSTVYSTTTHHTNAATILPSIPLLRRLRRLIPITTTTATATTTIPFRQILRVSLTALQFTICIYLCKAIYKSILELMEEYDEFYETYYGTSTSSSSSGSTTTSSSSNSAGMGMDMGGYDNDDEEYNHNYNNFPHPKDKGNSNNDIHHHHHHDMSNLQQSWNTFWNNKYNLSQPKKNSKPSRFSNNNHHYNPSPSSSSSSSSWNVEEHDLPFLKEDTIDHVLNDIITTLPTTPFPDEEEEEGTEKSPQRIRQNLPHQRIPPSTTSNLALRLYSSGIPLYNPIIHNNNYNNKNNNNPKYNDVHTILKSLTKTEGYLLSNSLLSPMDIQSNNGNVGSISSTRNYNHFYQEENDDNDKKGEKIVQMWNEIGGLEDIKEGLLDIAFPLMTIFQQQPQQPQQSQYEDTYDNDNHHDIDIYNNPNYYGGLLSNPPGILLYGPPGTGKSMLARALAQTIHARFLCITPSSLFRKYVGETNLNVRALFSLAKKIQPCVIFIDEMEGLFRERSGNNGGGGGGGRGDEHEVNRELKTEFMQLWDGIDGSSSCQNILIIGATNRPFDVDSAFLRRMPRSFFVGLPNYTSRQSILEKMLVNVPLEDGFDFGHITQITEGYTPSDMKEVLRTAALYPLREARMKVMEEYKRAMERNHVNGGKGSSPKLPSMGKLPPLRPLQTVDVIEAQQKVAPTQLSPHYRSALLQYASRATGGRVGIFGKSSNDNVDEKTDRRREFSDVFYPILNGKINDPSNPTYGHDGFYFASIDPGNGIHGDDSEYDDESSDYFDD